MFVHDAAESGGSGAPGEKPRGEEKGARTKERDSERESDERMGYGDRQVMFNVLILLWCAFVSDRVCIYEVSDDGYGCIPEAMWFVCCQAMTSRGGYSRRCDGSVWLHLGGCGLAASMGGSGCLLGDLGV